MQEASCHMRLKDHTVYIHIGLDLIHCFKYTKSRCLWETFVDLDEATDWMFKPFEVWGYVVALGPETQ